MDISGVSFRRCASIRSKQHKDQQCTYNAVNGDFCARHWKRPHRYVAVTVPENTYLTRAYVSTVRKIQIWWQKTIAVSARKRQGPAVHYRDLAQNKTEICSLDTLDSIPRPFFFSYADSQKLVWAFDIRSLAAILAHGQQPTNPYTRESLPPQILQKVRDRISYLRARKYALVYFNGEALTEEQAWNQKVLDVFMKLERLGYLSSCDWFNNLEVPDHKRFYRIMFQLWQWRLGLSSTEKEEIVPHHTRQSSRLFKSHPDTIVSENRDRLWWQKTNLALIHNFISRSTDKTKQSLGCMYVLMGLVQVSEDAAEAYPWIYDTVT
jgi:hypothetical protein